MTPTLLLILDGWGLTEKGKAMPPGWQPRPIWMT